MMIGLETCEAVVIPYIFTACFESLLQDHNDKLMFHPWLHIYQESSSEPAGKYQKFIANTKRIFLCVGDSIRGIHLSDFLSIPKLHPICDVPSDMKRPLLLFL